MERRIVRPRFVHDHSRCESAVMLSDPGQLFAGSLRVDAVDFGPVSEVVGDRHCLRI
jgi:hypothetical protein